MLLVELGIASSAGADGANAISANALTSARNADLMEASSEISPTIASKFWISGATRNLENNDPF
jgi:hypothetical protein